MITSMIIATDQSLYMMKTKTKLNSNGMSIMTWWFIRTMVNVHMMRFNPFLWQLWEQKTHLKDVLLSHYCAKKKESQWLKKSRFIHYPPKNTNNATIFIHILIVPL